MDIACMTTSPKHEELYYELLKEEHLVLLANRRCAIAGRIPSGTPIDILEARDETFICSRPGHSVRALQDSLFISREIKPKIGLETVSIEVGKRVAARGRGRHDLPGFLCRYRRFRSMGRLSDSRRGASETFLCLPAQGSLSYQVPESVSFPAP